MSKALIIFGSTTGNTENVAEKINEILGNKGVETTLQNVSNSAPGDLQKEYDLIVLGASTWGDDEIEFQEDFEPFYNDLEGLKLPGQKVALFGCGDSTYEHYCGAVDLLEKQMEEAGAKLVNPSLRIDGDPDDIASEIEEWSEEIAASI